jgi:hypothetical protein
MIEDKDVMITVKLNMEELSDIIQALDYSLNKILFPFNREEWTLRARTIKKEFGKMYNNSLEFKKEKDNEQIC